MNNQVDVSPSVGSRLRVLREERALSQRGLADQAGVSANEISLIERAGISPSVATLQRLATALSVRMSYFFDAVDETDVVHSRKGGRPKVASGGVAVESLGARLPDQQIEPFYLTLAPHADCGADHVVHLGQELVCCLSGCLEYEVQGQIHLLHPGDFLLFKAALPHCWRNPSDENAQFLLILQSPEPPGELARRHFARYPSVAHMG
jgi:transcriptional regulator with XRE-family HTH domain